MGFVDMASMVDAGFSLSTTTSETPSFRLATLMSLGFLELSKCLTFEAPEVSRERSEDGQATWGRGALGLITLGVICRD